MLTTFCVVTIFGAAVFSPGCSLLSHEAPTEDADKAAGLFFQRLNNNEYDKIYDDAAKRFRTNKTKASCDRQPEGTHGEREGARL